MGNSQSAPQLGHACATLDGDGIRSFGFSPPPGEGEGRVRGIGGNPALDLDDSLYPVELWRDAYVRNVRQSELSLALGAGLADRLEHATIPCIPLRGPFWGLQYWGDPAARTFSDLDFLVPRDHAGRALELLEHGGFRLRPRGMPARFFRAIHLHYPLVHLESGIYCDLHWAADHPFRKARIPYETIFVESAFQDFGRHRWRIPTPVHERLLTALHFAKEFPLPDKMADSTLWVRAVLSGQLKPLLDLAICGFPVDSGPEFDAVSRLAREWQIEEVVVRARSALRDFQDAILPVGWEPYAVGGTDENFFGSLGFRRRRLGDAWTYLRDGGGWRAGAHLIGAGCVAAVCLAVWKLRNLRLRGAT